MFIGEILATAAIPVSFRNRDESVIGARLAQYDSHFGIASPLFVSIANGTCKVALFMSDLPVELSLRRSQALLIA
jgi:hypothetical protein